jgi:hypothetical protein
MEIKVVVMGTCEPLNTKVKIYDVIPCIYVDIDGGNRWPS